MVNHRIATRFLAAFSIGAFALLPIAALAQSSKNDRRGNSNYSREKREDRRDNRYDWNFGRNTREDERRQQTNNEWRNIAYAAGALGLLGILQKDNTLTFAGAAGALYSVWRYEQDRKSQNDADRVRADYFSRGSFTRDGKRYTRKTVVKNGKKYYQFVRER